MRSLRSCPLSQAPSNLSLGSWELLFITQVQAHAPRRCNVRPLRWECPPLGSSFAVMIKGKAVLSLRGEGTGKSIRDNAQRFQLPVAICAVIIAAELSRAPGTCKHLPLNASKLLNAFAEAYTLENLVRLATSQPPSLTASLRTRHCGR